jgi:flagellar basal body-associated protein FliL
MPLAGFQQQAVHPMDTQTIIIVVIIVLVVLFVLGYFGRGRRS